MNEFFKTSDGQNAAGTGAEFELSGGFEPFPPKTRLKCVIQDAKWKNLKNAAMEFTGEKAISLTWSVLAPEEFKNRTVFQNIRIYRTDDPKKADNGKRMLGAIDYNAGGGIVQLGRKPTDQELQINLVNKIMVIEMGYMKTKAGDPINWVNKVSADTPQQAAVVSTEDDIPF